MFTPTPDEMFLDFRKVIIVIHTYDENNSYVPTGRSLFKTSVDEAHTLEGEVLFH